MCIRRRFLIPTLTAAILIPAGIDQLLSAPPPTRPTQKQAQFAPEQVLVKFKGTRTHPGQGPSAEQAVQSSLPKEAQQALGKVGHIQGVVPSLGLLCIRLRPGLAVGEAIEALYRSGAVEYAEPNYQIQLQGIPNDPLFSNQWGLHNTGQSGGTSDADIDAPAAWNIRKSANAVVVAVIDSGVDYNHEDLSANLWQNPGETPGNSIDDDGNGYIDDVYGWDFCSNDSDPMDTDGHGTQVAGVIAARGNNGKGISGVAWYGKIMALRCQSGDSGYVYAAIQGITYALALKDREGYRMILNCSWATNAYSQALYDALNAARSKGVLVVAATEVWTADHDLAPRYPACFDLDNIISVGPSNRYDEPYSNGYGTASVDLHAPGWEIWSTSLSNAYGQSSYYYSSSLAAAHVCGAAALVWSHRSSSGYKVIKGLILNGVESGQLPGAFKGKSVTEGRLNLNNSLADDRLDDPAIFSVTPNRAWVGDTITLKGVNFGSSGTLRFAGHDFPSGSIVSWGNSQIVAQIPTGLPKQAGRIQVITAAGTSRGAWFAHGWLEALVGHTLLPRAYAASAQISGAVWILGGQTNWGLTGIVEKYDLAANYSTIDSRWTMPVPVMYAGAAAIGSKIYVVGGYNGSSYVTALQIFDTQTKTWSFGAEAPTIFYWPAVVSYGGKLYVFGGAAGGMSRKAYSYDPGSDTWTALADMSTGTYQAAAAPLGTSGQILVMGGGWMGSELSVVQIYDINSNSWSVGPSLKKARTGAAGINYQNQVFCLHGYGGSNHYYLADSEYYASGTWRNTIFGPQELYAPLAGRSGRQIFILDGHYPNDYSNNVWRFTIP